MKECRDSRVTSCLVKENNDSAAITYERIFITSRGINRIESLDIKFLDSIFPNSMRNKMLEGNIFIDRKVIAIEKLNRSSFPTSQIPSAFLFLPERAKH